ncbi:DUF3846 domain-containing protein [Streptomyces sp. NPDC002276]
MVGGHLQVLNLERPAATMHLNNEGRLDGLPFNPRATALLWAHKLDLRNEDIIAGNALILGVPDRHATTPRHHGSNRAGRPPLPHQALPRVGAERRQRKGLRAPTCEPNSSRN